VIEWVGVVILDCRAEPIDQPAAVT